MKNPELAPFDYKTRMSEKAFKMRARPEQSGLEPSKHPLTKLNTTGSLLNSTVSYLFVRALERT